MNDWIDSPTGKRIISTGYECYPQCPYRPETPRGKYHKMLETAMDETQEGESFLPRFVALILQEMEVAKGS